MTRDELVDMFVGLNDKARRDGLLALDDEAVGYRLLASALEHVVRGRAPDEIRRALETQAGELAAGAEAGLRSRVERGRLTAEDAEGIRRRRAAEARLIVDGALAVQAGMPADALRARLVPGGA